MKDYSNIIESERYLLKFDNILNQMTNKMLSQNVINNITINFINCMIPHHQAAIYMCENLLIYTDNTYLIKIAKNIIEMQTRGINEMKEIRETSKYFSNSTDDVRLYMEKYLCITNNMIFKMKHAPRCTNINLNFVNEMIPHHEGAIKMCKNLLQYYINPKLMYVADTIISEQSEGIIQLKYVKKNLCNTK